MKNFIIITLALVALSACQSEKPAPPSSIKLAGQIENAPESTVIIKNGDQSDTLALENGMFSAEIQMETPGFLRLINGKESTQFYSTPGDSLHVYIDYNEFDESINYSGTSPDASNYLAQVYLKDEELKANWSTSEKYILDPERFADLEDSIKNSKMEFLGTYRDRIPKQLLEDQEMEITYSYAHNLGVYPEYAAWFQKNDSIELPSNWNDHFKDIALENEAALHIRRYGQYVEDRIQTATEKKLQDEDYDGKTWFFVMMESADELLKNPKVKSHFIGDLLSQSIQYYGTHDLDKHFEFYSSHGADSTRLVELKAEYASWDHLRAGNDAPDFTYSSIAGDTISLSDFEGKVVYVDVWATWCGPCLGEIPDLQILEEEYHEKDVVFMSVSVDDSVSDWEEMVKTDGLGGIQVATRSGWSSKITDDYKINGIPRFILVGRDGKLVSADAPRPSSGDEIRNMMNEALNSGTELADLK